MIKGHGGNVHDLALRLGCEISDITDMSSNLNPLGPPAGLNEHLKRNLDKILALPEVDAGNICDKFAKKYDLDRERIIAGNGTTQLIYLIPRALESKRSLIVAPTYSDYADSCKMNGTDFEYYYLKEEDKFNLNMEDLKRSLDGFDTIYICNPNNPTGSLIPTETLVDICNSYPDKYFIIDESYLPFVDNLKNISIKSYKLKNVIVLNSMSKIYRIPGLRIGFLIADEKVIEKFNNFLLPWSVNGLAYCAVEFLIDSNDTDGFEESSRIFFKEEISLFLDQFKDIEDFEFFPASTYFIIARTKRFIADELCEYLKKQKILIRDCSNFKGLSENFVRFSLKKRDTNLELCTHIKNFLRK
ncbi:MAG: pyridoxal phosphate-dependent class II aminotransferase [Deltaproteobacteria bacterium]|nr:pyridoxal phosphate-dependent class II aminotransferase [Deltaproteobacteria bacterium]